jgi:hypothetical protein
LDNQFQYENPFEAPEAFTPTPKYRPISNTNKLAYRSLGLTLLLKGILFFVFCASAPFVFFDSRPGFRFPWFYLPPFFFEIAVLMTAFNALKKPGEGRWCAFVSIFICISTILFLLFVFLASAMNF